MTFTIALRIFILFTGVFSALARSASSIFSDVSDLTDAPDQKFLLTDDMDFAPVDRAFRHYFDEVLIPADKKRRELDPRIYVSKGNSSLVGECSASTNRIIREADQKLTILGGGPAGLSAALYAARAEMSPLVVARDGGQLESTSLIDNYPGYENGVDAVELIMKLESQAARFGAKFKACTVKRVDLDCRPFRVACDDGEVITSSALIIATGAGARWLGVPGEMELLSKGVHTCATCDGYFYKGKHTAVIGGGDTAMEQALFLARMADRVTVLHRRDVFRASKAMATRVLNHPQITIIWNAVVKEFIAGDDGSLVALSVEQMDGTDSAREYDLQVDGAFVAIGHIPTTDLFGKVKKDEEGYIYTIPGSTVTSVTGVYAAGDVQDPVYRQAITSAGTGAMAAMDAERWLCEHGC